MAICERRHHFIGKIWEEVGAVFNLCPKLCRMLAVVSFYDMAKAGRLVGFADCYAVIALAGNATFLLAENRIAAHRSHSAVMCNVTISCRGSIGRASAPQS